MTNWRRTSAVSKALLLSTVAIGIAACGSSSSPSSSSSAAHSGSSSATKTSSSTEAASAGLTQATAFYSKFTGGSAGPTDSSKKPVVIGFMNDQGGVPSFPEDAVAGQAAVQFVNQKLGGVDGHPIKLSTCDVTSEAQGGSCAQQFLSQKLPVIIEANGNLGGDTFHQTIAGKVPVVMAVPGSAADATAKNSYGMSAGVFSSDAGFLAYATKYVHAHSASLLYPGDDPTSQVAAKGIEGFLGKGSVKVSAAGFSSSSPDMLPALVASGASHTDMTIALLVAPSACIAGSKAFQGGNITKPIIALQTCISQPVKQALGDYPKWTYISDATNPADPAGDPATTSYLQVMSAYAPSGAITGGSAQEAFVSVLAAARAFNHAGGATATPSAIGHVLATWTGPTPMLAPNVKYGAIPGLPAIPSLQARFYKYEGSGKWTDVTGGKWVLPQQ